MDDPIPVRTFSHDPISELGIRTQLRQRPEIRLVDEHERAAVVLVTLDSADEEAVRWLRSIFREAGTPVVLVIGLLDPRTVVTVIESGVCAVLRRAEATSERLVHTIQAAAKGQGDLPPDLVRHLINHVSQLSHNLLEPKGLSFAGLTGREREVLQLVADGMSTREVATHLAYSERTIKNVLQDLTTRLHLRNRTHAVAYAVRNGWI